MIQLLQQICLCEKALDHHTPLISGFPSDLFYRPLLIEPVVHGQVYDAHASLADLFQDLIFSVDHGSR